MANKKQRFTTIKSRQQKERPVEKNTDGCKSYVYIENHFDFSQYIYFDKNNLYKQNM